jgi:hypothetical protein
MNAPHTAVASKEYELLRASVHGYIDHQVIVSAETAIRTQQMHVKQRDQAFISKEYQS